MKTHSFPTLEAGPLISDSRSRSQKHIFRGARFLFVLYV